MKKKNFAAALAMLACASSMGGALVACDETTPENPQSYTIVFVTNGGSTVAEQGVTGGGKITEPGDPTRFGYEFDGWYKDENCTQVWTFETDKVTGDLTLYAKWKVKPSTSDTYFDYALIGDAYAIAAKTGQTLPADVVIPSTYNGKTVTAIADGAFEGQAAIKSVTVPDSVTGIGARAFRGCKALEQVLGGKNVERIGSTAFGSTEYDESLAGGAVYIGKTLYKYAGAMPAGTELAVNAGTVGIAAGALQDKKNLTKLTLPAGLKNIGNYAFGGTTAGVGVTEIVLPDSVEIIGDNAFRNAKALASVTIGKNTEKIGANAFTGTALADVTYKATDAHLNETFKDLATEATLTVTDDVEAIYAGLIKGWTGLKSVTIGSGVTSVPDSMFDGMTALESVTLGSATQTIGSFAFRASGIKKIAIPESVNKIGALAFANCAALAEVEYNAVSAEGTPENSVPFKTCAKLAKVTVGDKVTAIPAYLFMNAASLTSLTLGAKVETIGEKAFYGTGITELALPATLATVGASAFEGAKFASLTLPAALATVGEKAFGGNTALTTVALESTSAVQQGTVGMFEGCIAISTFTVGSEVASIPAYILKGNTRVTAVALGAKVIAVGAHAFDGCTALETLTGYERLTDIGAAAFDGTPWYAAELNKDGPVFVGTVLTKWNGALTASIEIPAKATAIAADAFASSTDKASVTAITFAGDKLETIGDNVFKDFVGLKSIAVPESVKTIGDNAFMDCSELTSITFEGNSRLRIVGSGAFCRNGKLRDVTFPDSMEEIGANALYGVGGKVVFGTGCTKLGSRLFAAPNGDPAAAYNNVTQIEINGAVTEIPAGFLDGIGNVKSMVLPQGVQKIGDRAFYGCANLTTLDLSSVTSIGKSAFEICGKLAAVDLNPDVTEIGNFAFKESGLTGELVFNELTSVSERAFESTKISKVVFKKIVEIGNSAFASCSPLVSVDFGKTLKVIRGSFYNCPIDEITLPASVTQIDRTSFNKLSKVYLDGLVNPASVKTDSFNADVLILCNHEHYAAITASTSGWALGAGTKWEEWKERFVDESLYFVENGWTVVGGKVLKYEPADGYEAVVLPKAVTELESILTVFGSTENVAKCISLSVQEGSTAFKMQNGALISADGTTLYYYIGGSDPLAWNDVTTVKQYAFFNRIIEEKTLTLPKVTAIGAFAFSGCTGLKTFDFSKLTEIPNSAFFGSGLTGNIELPQATVGDRAFMNCTGLTGVKLTAVTSLGTYVFSGCSALSKAEIAGPVKKLSDYCFDNCVELSDVKIPDGITTIGFKAFNKCVLINENNFTFPSKLTVIERSAFNYCGFVNLVIPSAVESFDNAFDYCESLESVDASSSLITAIGSFASFAHCTSLKRVVLPSGMTSIDTRNMGLTNLPVRVLDTYATRVSGMYAFCKGNPIVKLILRGDSVTDISSANLTLDKADAKLRIYVKDELVEAYKANTNWAPYAHRIVALSTLTDNSAPEIVTGGTWTVDENGVASAYTGALDNVVISANVTGFAPSENGVLGLLGEDVAFLDNVTFSVEAGNTAFKVVDGALVSADGTVMYAYSTSAPAEFTSEAITTLKSCAFAHAVKLTSVNLPNITTLEANAFRGCKNLAAVDLGDRVATVAQNAFSGIKADANVYIDTVTPPAATSPVFDDGFTGKIYVPADSAEAYKAATGWSAHAANIECKPYEITIGNWKMWNDGRFISYDGTFAYDGTETVVIPKELTTLPSDIYNEILKCASGNANRTKVKMTLEEGNTAFKMQDGVLMSADETIIYAVVDYSAAAGKSYVFENAVRVNMGAFALSGIVGVDLPNVERIARSSFYKTTSLTTLNIGAKLNWMDTSSVFNACTAVVTILAVDPPTGGTTIFVSSSSVRIYVPDASVEAYKAAKGWSKVAGNIKPLSEKPASASVAVPEALPADGKQEL